MKNLNLKICIAFAFIAIQLVCFQVNSLHGSQCPDFCKKLQAKVGTINQAIGLALLYSSLTLIDS
jgi:hypothetical protein